MLVLSRKVGEKIVVGDEVVVVINRIAGNRVSIGIHAPNHVRIVRGELPVEESFGVDPSNDHFASERMSPGSNAFAARCDE